MWVGFYSYVLGFVSVGKVLPVLVSEADKSGWGFVRARFRHLVHEISFTRVWARFRQLVDEMGLMNIGKVLPVLISGAVKCGRGFAGLFMRRVWEILGRVLSVLMREVVKCGRGFAGLFLRRVCQVLGKVLPVLINEWNCQIWARFRRVINGKNLTNFGPGFASINEWSCQMWAKFHRIVYKEIWQILAKVLPVLMSEAV